MIPTKKFLSMFSNFSNLDREKCRLTDERGYNVPMAFLSFDKFDICLFNRMIYVFYMLDLCDINHHVIEEGKEINIVTLFIKYVKKNIKSISEEKEIKVFQNKCINAFDMILQKGFTRKIPSLKRVSFLRPYLNPIEIPKKTIMERSEIDEFQNINARSAFGDIFLTKHSNSKLNIIVKLCKGSKDMYDNEYFETSDLYKEFIISRNVNSHFPGTCIEMFGMTKTSTRGHCLVMERGVFSLGELLELLEIIPIELKKNFILSLFRKIFKRIGNVNLCGFCHFDLKIENIIIMANMEPKIIDFGISCFMGVKRHAFDEFSCTASTKAPEDPEDTKSILVNKKLIYSDSLDKDTIKINYSTDCFSIGSIMFSAMVGGDLRLQAVFLGDKVYSLYNNCDDNNNSIRQRFRELTENEMDNINLYSQHAMNFLRMVTSRDSNIRPTAFEAIKHEIFGGPGISRFVDYRTVTELVIEKERIDFQFTATEISLRSDELRIYNNYLSIAEKLTVKSNVGKMRNFPDLSPVNDIFQISIMQQISEENRSSQEDEILQRYNRMNKKDFLSYFEINNQFQSIIRNANCRTEYIYPFLIQCNLDMNYWNSAVNAFVTKCRIENRFSCEVISNFTSKIIGKILSLMNVERPVDLNLFYFFEYIVSKEDFEINGETYRRNHSKLPFPLASEFSFIRDL